MVTLDATVFPDEAYVLVQTDWLETVLRDSFTRVSASGWGTPDVGPAWAVQFGLATEFTVNGTSGVITHPGSSDKAITSPVGLLDFDISGTAANTVLPTGGNFEIKVLGRFVDANNFVDARIFLAPAGTVTANIRQRVAGVDTASAFPAVSGVTSTGTYGFRFQGSGSQLRFRAWSAGSPEPDFWNVTFTTTWLTAGAAGVGSLMPGSVTNPYPIVITFDNIVVFDPNNVAPDCATVTRTNTVTGETVTLRPYVFFNEDGALMLECGQGLWWDTEPPLNVPLEYCVTACEQQVALTQNPGFETTTVPWTVSDATSLAVTCTSPKFGSCYGRLTPNGTSSEPRVSQTGFALTGGVPATFSGWVRSDLGWNGVRLGLDITYVDFTMESVFTPVEIVDDDVWRFLTFTFTPRLDTNTVSFFFEALGIPTALNFFDLDEMQVTQGVASTETACETVTVESDSVWLKNPLHPCLDVEIGLCSPMLEDCDEDARVTYVGMDGDERTPNTTLLQPDNRQHPIPRNRIRRGPASTLRLLAHDCQARDALVAVNEPGDPLLFQAPADYCIADRYTSVGTVSETRISVDQREDFRLFGLPHVTVDRPAGPADGICGSQISDLCDIYTSWAAIAMAGLTWTGLLLGEASHDGPGQGLPADARTWGEVETEFTDWADVEDGGTRDWGELRDGA